MRRHGSIRRQRGGGLIEFMVALLVVSVGMVSLLSSQRRGAEIGLEVQQRTAATRMASDLLTRIQLEHYLLDGPRDPAWASAAPAVDCGAVSCSATQLARYELWHWLRQLSAGFANNRIGEAPPAPACVGRDRDRVVVSVGWLSRVNAARPVRYACSDGLIVPGGSAGQAPIEQVRLVSVIDQGRGAG